MIIKLSGPPACGHRVEYEQNGVLGENKAWNSMTPKEAECGYAMKDIRKWQVMIARNYRNQMTDWIGFCGHRAYESLRYNAVAQDNMASKSSRNPTEPQSMQIFGINFVRQGVAYNIPSTPVIILHEIELNEIVLMGLTFNMSQYISEHIMSERKCDVSVFWKKLMHAGENIRQIVLPDENPKDATLHAIPLEF